MSDDEPADAEGSDGQSSPVDSGEPRESSEGSDATEAQMARDPDLGSSEGSDEEDRGTTSTSRRHWLTNDGLAVVLVLSLISVVALHGAGRLTLQTVPQSVLLLYVFSVGSAVAWAFGKDAVEAWRGGQ